MSVAAVGELETLERGKPLEVVDDLAVYMAYCCTTKGTGRQ